MNDIYLDIPKDNLKYLDEICDKLSKGNAAIIVGSGFSKNSIKKTESATELNFPDWSELGKIFFFQLNGRYPEENESDYDLLELADKIIVEFNRAVLEQLLIKYIPDNDYEPSDLHKDLLKLPWSDVFTTNYDTLLERASYGAKRKYSVVATQNDLPHVAKPRLIKLHGSFPSNKPFIVSAQDYLDYTGNFPLFTQTIQQSLLENVICLVGFSGKDPNFLKWLSWIQGNLAKIYNPKIYLIGIFDFDKTHIKLLSYRNINVINMSDDTSLKDDDYRKAHILFLQYLHLKLAANSNNSLEATIHLPTKIVTPLKDPSLLSTEWLISESQTSPSLDLTEIETIKEIIKITKKWKDIRLVYPGWIICPEDYRQTIWNTTHQWCAGKHFGIRLPENCDIEFLYELNWRLEKCLCPIFNDLENIYQKIISRYNITDSTFNTSKMDTDIFSLQKKNHDIIWIQLQISILRFYREEGFTDKWISTYEILNSINRLLSLEQAEQLIYEKSLFQLFNLDIPALKTELSSWVPNQKLPLWNIKHAGLLAELGEIEKAEKIIDFSLETLKKQPESIYNLSVEAYGLQLFKLLKDHKHYWKFSKQDAYVKSINDRWNEIRLYKCDPWNELKLFKSRLDKETKPLEAEETTYGFDIGKESTTHHFNSYDKNVFWGYAFLRYVEEIGVPFHIPNMTFGIEVAAGAIAKIHTHSRFWATATMIRMGNEKYIDIPFNRATLAKLKSVEFDLLIDKYLKALQDTTDDVSIAFKTNNQNLGTHLASILPEIISRLSVKSSLKRKYEIFKFLKDIFNSPYKSKYDGIGNLTKRLLESWPLVDLANLIPEIIVHFPLVVSSHPGLARDFSDPINYIDSELIIDASKFSTFPEDHINDLIKRLTTTLPEEKGAVFNRLYRVYSFGLLNKQQIENFGHQLWLKRDSTGLPELVNNYYRFIFIKTPSPRSVNSASIIKQFLLSLTFPIVGDSRHKGVSITGGLITQATEIIASSQYFQKENGIDWDDSDAWSIFKKLLHWWETDHKYLNEESGGSLFGGIKNEFKSRFNQMSEILTTAVLPFLPSTISPQEKLEISKLLTEMEAANIHTARAQIAALHLFPESFENTAMLIDLDIVSENFSKATQAIKSIYDIAKNIKSSSLSLSDKKELVSKISQCIKWRKFPALLPALVNMAALVRNFSNLIDDNMIKDINTGLDYLIDETNLLNDQSLIPLEKRLQCRELAAGLAFDIYQRYQVNKKPLPIVISRWKEICENLDEFAEIRNQWGIN